MKTLNQLSSEDKTVETFRNIVMNFVNEWGKMFVIDYWWRKKYNIPFGSKQHREMSFIDMAIEYQEEKLVNSIIERKENEDNELLGLNLSEDKEVVKMSQSEIDSDYENFNIEEYGEHNNRCKRD